MDAELKNFLTRNHACSEGLSRLAATGSATPEEAWERADASDLIWAVTRPGVMSADQRRRFLAEAVLAPIEHLLTDERSKNILQKLRTNEPITAADAAASWAAYVLALARASSAAADAAWASSSAASAARAAWAAYAEAYAAAARAARAAAADAAAKAQAKWIRDNFVLNELNIK